MRLTELPGVARAAAGSPASARIAYRVRRGRLTYLTPRALLDLARAVREVEHRKIEGSLVEAGTALGGSAIVMTAAKGNARPLTCYDMFGMIPPPTEHDGPDVHDRYEKIVGGESQGLGGETYYGYRPDLRAEVETSFAEYGLPCAGNRVTLVQGDFGVTIPVDDESPVALAHLDGDWYESTKVCLDRLAPRTVAGGRLVIDDYDSWSGCRTAVDEFIARHQGWRVERRTRLHLVRV